MKDNVQTAQDIFYRNKFSSSLQIKIPSHHASKQFINILLNTHILNKLALLPFYQQQKLALLYKGSLQYLLHLSSNKYKNQQFMRGLLLHLQNWEINMSIFDSWRYTRAVFYYLEAKNKHNQQLLELFMLKRAILQPKKQQFIQKSQNSIFKNNHLKSIKSITNNKNEILQMTNFEYNLPQDILLIDDNQSWKRLQFLYSIDECERQKAIEYLNEYENTGIIRYLKNNIKQKINVQSLLANLYLRNNVFKVIHGAESAIINRVINNFKKRTSSS